MSLEVGNGFAGGDVTVGFTLIDGNGTTASGSACDLGGTLTAATTITQAGNDISFVDGNFTIFGKGSSTNQIGLSYVDAQTETTSAVFYDSGSGNSFYAANCLDVSTSNESSISVAYDRARIAFLDFSVEPTQKNSIEVFDTGVLVEGNQNNTSTNMKWIGFDGVNPVDLALLQNNGNWQWDSYPNTRDDTGTFTPTSFLYSGAAGELYSAPLSSLTAGWALTGNAGLTDGVDNFIGTTDDVPLRFLINNNEFGVIGDATNPNSLVIGTSSPNGYGLSGVTIYGADAGAGGNGTKDNCTFIGASCGGNLTNVSDCVYVGANSGNNYNGIQNVLVGSGAGFNNAFNNSIGIGYQATIINDNEFAIGTQTSLNFASVTNIKTAALNAFDDDADAGSNGLTTGDWYQTTGAGAAPLNVAGIVMIKQ